MNFPTLERFFENRAEGPLIVRLIKYANDIQDQSLLKELNRLNDNLKYMFDTELRWSHDSVDRYLLDFFMNSTEIFLNQE